MAFRPLTDAECGQKNALLRLTSHVTHDHVFSETQGHAFPSSSDQLVEQFLQETRALPQTFRMDDLMREMQEIESQRSVLPPVPASTVKDQLHDGAWAKQYIDDGKVFQRGDEDAVWAAEHLEEAIGDLVQPDDQINEQKSQTELHITPEQLWENLSNTLQNNETEKVSLEHTKVDDQSGFEYSKFMKFMKQIGGEEINLEHGKLSEQEVQSWSEEFLSNNNAKTNDILEENWQKIETDENELKTENVEDVDERENYFSSQFWNNLEEEFKQGIDSVNDHPWLSDYEGYVGGNYKDYVFSEDNPMAEINHPLDKGKEFLANGDLPSAVLCFEAAVKQTPNSPEAWLLLGKTQAENEQDPNAIPALKKCLEFDPGNLTALMALAVSYTNESYYIQAGQTLVEWLKANPKYNDLARDFQLNLNGQVSSFLEPDQHKQIQDLFIRAAQRQPQDIDYEVQCGLGVLCNVSGEYDKAADCFRTALSVNPNDAKLWNRLGATLANGSKSEEAVEAYHRALSLEPGFIRARYNVGIVCINLRAYKEAAEHFLIALNQQARGRDVMKTGAVSQMSDTIWSTLRMCVSLMNRGELKQAIDDRDLKTLNQAFALSFN